MNNLAVSLALPTAPSSAFLELRERPKFWFPLLLLVGTAAVMMFWYYSVVDIEWLKDAMFTNNPDFQSQPEDKRAAAMAMIGRDFLRWSSTIGVIFAFPIYFLVQALYLWLAATVTKLPQGFKHWFALSCWTALPMLIGSVVAAILLLISDTAQMAPGVLQPLSLNELVFHRPLGSPGQPFLEAVGIPMFLMWTLLVIGVRVWSQRSWLFSAVFALLPHVVLYGLWAFFSLR